MTGKLEEKTFEFPLSYPPVNIKCKVEEEDNEKYQIICKLQNEFKDVNYIAIESRIVTKMNKEILFIEKKLFNNNLTSCINYNKIKFVKAKQNRNASFTFLTYLILILWVILQNF